MWFHRESKLRRKNQKLARVLFLVAFGLVQNRQYLVCLRLHFLSAGPFAEFYAELLARGMRPEIARLTLARKLATIVLVVWKRGV
jgi:hypothetical protein